MFHKSYKIFFFYIYLLYFDFEKHIVNASTTSEGHEEAAAALRDQAAEEGESGGSHRGHAITERR